MTCRTSLEESAEEVQTASKTAHEGLLINNNPSTSTVPAPAPVL